MLSPPTDKIQQGSVKLALLKKKKVHIIRWKI
jgi:hypothetical protein